ncbi:MAG: hypothetical protein PWQ11_683, partial [Candidatus Diapherotrites archaeon]|nr:hypothetical protein [Candidatus Diapherotrites archaeon]
MDREFIIVAGATLLMLLVAAAVAVLYIPKFQIFGDRVSFYEANVNYDGNGVFTVSERFVFKLDKTRHLIYRDWDVSAYLSIPNHPGVHVLDVRCPPGTLPYINQPSGIYVFYKGAWVPEYEVRYDIPTLPYAYMEMAKMGEVGCASETGTLPAGTYEMRVRFSIYPPVQCDGQYCHANISLAGNNHFPYSNVRVAFSGVGVKDYVIRPPKWMIALFGLNGNQRLEIEALLAPVADYPFIQKTHGVKSRYELAKLSPDIYDAYRFISLVLLFLIPLLIFAYWFLYGREKEYPDVPDFLTNVPNPERKPWVVNAVFNGKAGEFDKGAFISTIMDLERRGILRFEKRGDETVIVLPKSLTSAVDDYEYTVLAFLRRYSVDGIFSPKAFKKVVEDADRLEFLNIYGLWKELTNGSILAKDAAKQFVRYPSKIIRNGLAGLAILYFVISYISGDAFSFGVAFAMLANVAILSGMSPDVLGRWKDGYGREYSRWQAFKRFLSDLTRIKEYSEQFRSMWQDWLIYGAALGVADKVLKAIKELNVPDVSEYSDVY